MELYKVKIFPKNEDFLSELISYLFENSQFFKREFSIDNILNQFSSPQILVEKLSPIPIKEKYGSTFQSYYRNNHDIQAISHQIHSISVDGFNYFANIELTQLEYNEYMILRPVYYKSKDSSE